MVEENLKLLVLLGAALVSSPALSAPTEPPDAREPGPDSQHEPTESSPADSVEGAAESGLSASKQEDEAALGAAKAEDKAEAKEEPISKLGSQKDDRGPIGKGFGKRWIATPTVSSNPKLSTSFGATGIVFLRLDDSIASVIAVGGAYSVTNSWTAFLFGRFNFRNDRERIMAGLMRGHAANSYENFMDQGIALESTANILATPLVYWHRLGERTKTDWWIGGQFLYLRLDQSGNDPTSSDIISNLGLDGSDAIAAGPNVLFDSRDNTNSPTKGQNLFVRGNVWGEVDPEDGSPFFGSVGGSYSYFIPTKYFVLALNGSARFSFGAPLIFQSSLSNFRAYTVGEQIAEHTMSVQAEARVPFGHSRFGAAVFSGLATLFNNFSDWGNASTYYPMVGGGLRFVMSEQQRSIIRLEYAQGIDDARGIYLAMGQAF